MVIYWSVQPDGPWLNPMPRWAQSKLHQHAVSVLQYRKSLHAVTHSSSRHQEGERASLQSSDLCLSHEYEGVSFREVPKFSKRTVDSNASRNKQQALLTGLCNAVLSTALDMLYQLSWDPCCVARSDQPYRAVISLRRMFHHSGGRQGAA